MKDIYYKLIDDYDGMEARGAEADKLILSDTDSSDLYTALNPDRSDCVYCFPWDKSQKVLCCGAVFGAYTELAEQAAQLDIADEADERLELIRRRFGIAAGKTDKAEESGSGAYANVRLIKAAEDCDYDAVIADITDTDEESLLFRDKQAFISSACTHLRRGGSLILIADNADTLKFIAGIKPLHEEFLISREFAESIRSDCGFAGVKRYYPLPNAAFARNIYSESFMPGIGSFKDINDTGFEERRAVYNDEALYGSLCEKGHFADYAPSYIYVYTGYGVQPGEDPEAKAVPDEAFADYIRFNRGRADKYALKTELYTGSGRSKRFVRKSALTPAANEHIQSFGHKYELITRAYSTAAAAASEDAAGSHTSEEPAAVNSCSTDSATLAAQHAAADKTAVTVLMPHMGMTDSGTAYADFDFVEGRELSKLLAEHIRDGRAPEQEINAAIEALLGEAGTACHNLDALFENVLVDKDGSFCLIDYEWVFDEGIDYEFVKYRILSYWYDSCRAELTAYADKAAFISGFGIDEEKQNSFSAQEAAFQHSVRGDETWADIADRFRPEQVSPHFVMEQKRRISELTEWNLRLQDEVEEHKTALAKEREVERLSQNHIRNIESIRSNQEAELKILREQNAYLAGHQSLTSKVKRRFIAAVDAWAPADSGRRKFIHYAKNTLRHPGRMLKLYCTAEGRLYISGDLKIGGEFADGGRLVIPSCSSPKVSIVIPAYNQIAYTYACIRSIIANTDMAETPYEIILADDVSTDATAEIDKYISNLIISRNSSNMGFLKNCNQAARRAHGEYILFLNNDTKVHEGWLSALTELADSDDSIGMVGSKLVYADGRLQEAGGIIWDDASGWNYGRLDNPDKPEYNYVKDVDYISGAAIMISSALWKEIGGFDEYFAPAYCEDSDLAFEVRKHGKRVVYQPKSVVTHFEGISNGTDVQGTGLKRYQLVNQDKFRKKWADELKKQSVNTGNPDPFSARDRSQTKPCVAIIDHYVPTWDKDAGSKTTYQYIRMFLKKGFNVKFIGDNFLHEEPYTTALQQLGVEVLYGTEYRDNIYEYLRKNSGNIDFCYLNRPHIAVKYIDFLKKNTDIKCIFYGHDLHYLRLLREYELTGDIRKKRESDYWKSVEFSVMEQADMVYYPSEVEIEAIHKLHPEIPAKAITAYVWDDFNENAAAAADFGHKEGLLFVGGFKHPPNADAVKWFAESIMPKVRETIPDLTLYVAGSGADEEVLKLNDSSRGIEILGFVSDERLAELYRTTRLTVVPLRYGAGVKGKVVEAIYNNTAIITTSVGAEGIPEADKVMVVVDDDPEKLIENTQAVEQIFADKLTELYQDTDGCRKLAAACGTYIREHYSIDAAWSVIEEDFADGSRNQGNT